MLQNQSLQGWTPEIAADLTLAQVVEFAFDYRGDVTVLTKEGTAIEGYLFNRGIKNNVPSIQLMRSNHTDTPITIPYEDITNIKFTGRDTASGKSYTAYVNRKSST